MNRKITVLGSTGSIGTQTLDVIRHLNGAVEGLAAHRNTALLEKQAREFCPRRVAVGDPDCYGALKTALADTDIEVSAGPQAVAALAAEPADAVLNAVVGIAGLESTLAALEAHNTGVGQQGVVGDRRRAGDAPREGNENPASPGGQRAFRDFSVLKRGES